MNISAVIVEPHRRAILPRYSHGLCEGLRACEVDARLAVAHDLEVPLEGATPLLPLLFRWSGGNQRRVPPPVRRVVRLMEYRRGMLEVAKYVADNGIDVLHLQWLLVPPLDLSVLKVLKRAARMLVLTAHNTVSHTERPFERAFLRRLYPAFDHIFVHAEHSKHVLIRDFGVAGSAITQIPLPTYPYEHVPVSSHREACRRSLGIPRDREVILFFGLIRPYKGLALLLEAFREVARAREKAHLLIAGDPVDGYRRYAKLIDRLGVRSRVSERLRFVPDDEVGELFCAADVVALPYLAVDQSAVPSLAAYHRRSVVATNVGGLPESVIDGVTGLVMDPSPRSLADALVALLEDQPLRKRMEGATAERAQTSLTRAAVASATAAAYEKLLYGMS